MDENTNLSQTQSNQTDDQGADVVVDSPAEVAVEEEVVEAAQKQIEESDPTEDAARDTVEEDDIAKIGYKPLLIIALVLFEIALIISLLFLEIWTL